MPTYNAETLHDRYAREHAGHLARLAKMTPEQIAEMELSLHNALAEVDRLRTKANRGGEAVYQCREVGESERTWLDITKSSYGQKSGSDEWVTRKLYTHPAEKVADGVVVSLDLLQRVCREDGASNDIAMEELRDLVGQAGGE